MALILRDLVVVSQEKEVIALDNLIHLTIIVVVAMFNNAITTKAKMHFQSAIIIIQLTINNIRTKISQNLVKK